MGGDGIGRLPDGRVVFVPGTLPGDVADIELTHVHKRVQYGKLQILKEASPDRVASVCDVESCGGCPLREASPSLQMSQKRTHILESFARIGKIDVSDKIGTVQAAGLLWHYRHRVHLHAHHNGKTWDIGYHASKSHHVIPFSQCPVLWPELFVVTQTLVSHCRTFPAEAHLSDIEIAYSKREGRAAAKFQISSGLDVWRTLAPTCLRGEISGVQIESAEGSLACGNIELRYDHKRASQFDMRYEPGLFTQANPAVNDTLVDAVLQSVNPHEGLRVLELHAGVGNFTLPLARSGATVVASELHKRAVILAKRNMQALGQALGTPITCISERDSVVLRQGTDADVLLLDPPRVGAREAFEALLKTARTPDKIVYVSCDAATLARDAGLLCHGGGYVLTSLQAFDMFPQTPHVETLAVFQKE